MPGRGRTNDDNALENAWALSVGWTISSRGELTTALTPGGAEITRVSSTASSGERRKTLTGRCPRITRSGVDDRNATRCHTTGTLKIARAVPRPWIWRTARWLPIDRSIRETR